MTETAVADLPGSTITGSKSEQAYQAVKARIVEGAYTPGYRLVLASIAKDLGFSVVPVREAIRRLEAEGLVTFERNVGATVAGIDPTEYLYTMQTLSIVEGAATAMSAPLIDATAIAEELVDDCITQEQEETFIFEMVKQGNSVDGLYPMNKEWQAKYKEWERQAND